MRIVWVSFAPLERNAEKTTSSIASVRYRLLLPSASLHALGCESKVIAFAPDEGRKPFSGADVVVLGKLFPDRRPEPVLDLIPALRKDGVRVIADFSDDHFAHPQLGATYRALANGVEHVVASTTPLADTIREHARAQVSVITDPSRASAASRACRRGRRTGCCGSAIRPTSIPCNTDCRR